MVNFHYNYNTELFCNFVKYQLTPPVNTSDENIRKSKFVQLQAVALTELFKRILPLTIYEQAHHHDELMSIPERQNRLTELYLVIGDFLYGQANSAAYLYFTKVSMPAAEKMAAEMLYQEIMLLKGESGKGIQPGRTRQSLQQEFPIDYPRAVASILQKAQACLVPEEDEPELPETEVEGAVKFLDAPVLLATEKTKAAEETDEKPEETKAIRMLKRHGSPVFSDAEARNVQPLAKSARVNSQQAEEDTHLPPPAPPVLKG